MLLPKFLPEKLKFMSSRNVFSKTEILSVLSLIQAEYTKIYSITTVKNTKLMKAYAQMAIIAIGGWLEDGLDELAQLSIAELSSIDRQNHTTNLVKRIYGFDYKDDFSKAIMLTFGAHGLEFIELKVGDSDIAILKSSLETLKVWRNHTAHSQRNTIIFNPAQVINEFNKIFPILKKIDKYARKYKNKHF